MRMRKLKELKPIKKLWNNLDFITIIELDIEDSIREIFESYSCNYDIYRVYVDNNEYTLNIEIMGNDIVFDIIEEMNDYLGGVPHIFFENNIIKFRYSIDNT